MALEALIWKRGAGDEKRVANIAVRGSNISGDDYDPVHQEVIDIEYQQHHDTRRVLNTTTGILRERTAQETTDEPAKIIEDGELVNG